MRRRRNLESDTSLNPLHLIAAGVIGAELFIVRRVAGGAGGGEITPVALLRKDQAAKAMAAKNSSNWIEVENQ